MSCHSIGHGVNTITSEIIDQYEAGKLGKDTFRILLYRCSRAVHWCDGNTYEAMEALEDEGYCGVCLDKKDELVNLYENGLGYSDRYDIAKGLGEQVVNSMVCEACREKLAKDYRAKKSAGRKQI